MARRAGARGAGRSVTLCRRQRSVVGGWRASVAGGRSAEKRRGVKSVGGARDMNSSGMGVGGGVLRC